MAPPISPGSNPDECSVLVDPSRWNYFEMKKNKNAKDSVTITSINVVDPNPVGSRTFWPGRLQNNCNACKSDLFWQEDIWQQFNYTRLKFDSYL
jgi:hypothetical protein